MGVVVPGGSFSSPPLPLLPSLARARDDSQCNFVVFSHEIERARENRTRREKLRWKVGLERDVCSGWDWYVPSFGRPAPIEHSSAGLTRSNRSARPATPHRVLPLCASTPSHGVCRALPLPPSDPFSSGAPPIATLTLYLCPFARSTLPPHTKRCSHGT